MTLYTRKGDTGTTKTFGCDLPAPRLDVFFVYAILCDDNSIYIGQTNDLQKRLREHFSDIGAEHFTKHKPLRLIHYEEYARREDAVKREHNLKSGFGRKWLKREWKAGRTRQAGQRISKSSVIAEALGSLDEINSFLGLCKIRASAAGYRINTVGLSDIIHQIQQNLFMIQAELAGAPKKIEESKVKEIEAITDSIEKELPPIKTFFISGGTELATLFDVARTIARRAERRVVKANEESARKLGEHTLAYINRLSSVLYALARFSNHEVGISEEPPSYK